MAGPAAGTAVRSQAYPRRFERIVATAGLLLALFFAAWLPRYLVVDTFVTADESKWLNRSGTFYYALSHGDLGGTFQREHPGVTILWAGMLGYVERFPEYVQQVGGPVTDIQLEQWLRASTDHTPLELLAAGRRWVVVAVALAVTFCFFPLRRLFGTLAAALGVLAIAWGPFFLGLSFELHPIGLLTALVTLTFLCFLAWLYAGRARRYLIASGIAFGLATLTQTLAAAIGPVVGVLVLAELVRTWRGATAKQRWLLPGALVLWGVLGIATFVALWPAMWVSPVGVVQRILGQLGAYAEDAHVIGYYFMGEPTRDPGWLFYPVNLLLRSSPFSCLGLLAGVVWAVYGWRAGRKPGAADAPWPLANPTARRAFWALLVFVAFYTVIIAIAAKKAGRYLLPAFPMMDIAALLGWLATAYFCLWWFQQRRQQRRPVAPVQVAAGAETGAEMGAPAAATGAGTRGWTARAWAAGIVGVLLLLAHAAPGFVTYPYYLTYYNALGGGPELAEDVLGVGWGEGLDAAARWLNQQPNADKLRIASWYGSGPLSYFLKSDKPVGDFLGAGLWFDNDYIVTYVNQWLRQNPEPDIFTYLDTQTPAFVAKANGMELARVYDRRGMAPPPFTHQYTDRTAQFGDDLRLAAYKLRSFAAQPGDTVKPILYLKALQPISEGYLARLRLLAPDGTVVWQSERPPANLSTRGWAQDEIRVDDYRIQLSNTITPGLYTLDYALVDRDSKESLPIKIKDGEQASGAVTFPFAQIRVDAPPKIPVDVHWEEATVTSVQHPASVRPGDSLLVITEHTVPPAGAPAVKLSLRLVDDKGNVVAQQDKDLAPSLRWTLALPDTLAPGTYHLIAILYRPDTLAALPDAAGQLQSQLSSVEIAP